MTQTTGRRPKLRALRSRLAWNQWERRNWSTKVAAGEAPHTHTFTSKTDTARRFTVFPQQGIGSMQKVHVPVQTIEKTTTHSPAPWHAKDGEIVSADGEIVGVAYRAEAWSSGEKIGYEEQANAALLTAAPDLLAALKGVLRIADRRTIEFDVARAAIAKAEGRR